MRTLRQAPDPQAPDQREPILARPNYSFEKRQRELAKKRKKEEKAAVKAGSHGGDAGATSEAPRVPVAASIDAPPPAESPAEHAETA